MIWMEIHKCNQKQGDTISTLVNYPPFLVAIQREAREKPNAVVLIECKNEYSSRKPASAYEIAYLLDVPTALTVSIEGHGISPFLHALFIANFHLRANATSVIVVASVVSSVLDSLSGGEFKSSKNIYNYQFVRLSIQQPARAADSLLVFALPVNYGEVPHNQVKVEDTNDLNFRSVSIMASSSWFLNLRSDNASQTDLVILSDQHIENPKLKSICCDSCFDLIKKIPVTLASAEMTEKGLLLVSNSFKE